MLSEKAKESQWKKAKYVDNRNDFLSQFYLTLNSSHSQVSERGLISKDPKINIQRSVKNDFLKKFPLVSSHRSRLLIKAQHIFLMLYVPTIDSQIN